MKTVIISIVFVALLAAGFSSKNQDLTSVKPKVIINDLTFTSLKKPDYKLVRELKALSTNASVLNKEVNFYKEKLVVKEDSIQIDSVLKKKFIPRVIDKIIN